MNPPTSQGRPLAVADRLRLLPPVHAAAYALRWVGLRSRLRCPSCKAVGTWKPHGTLSDRWFRGDRPARRWLCKWCGHYVGPEGVVKAFPDPDRGCWVLPRPWDPASPQDAGPTPADVVAGAMGKTWPWAG